jgi:hypothetical protein
MLGKHLLQHATHGGAWGPCTSPAEWEANRDSRVACGDVLLCALSLLYSPLSNLCKTLWPERPLCVNVQGLALSSTHVHRELHVEGNMRWDCAANTCMSMACHMSSATEAEG